MISITKLGKFFNQRIALINFETGCNNIDGLGPGIRTMCVIDRVIILGGDEGYIQKIFFGDKNWMNASPQILDKNYFVLMKFIRKLMKE